MNVDDRTVSKLSTVVQALADSIKLANGKRMYEIVEKWRAEHRPSCPESIVQMDTAILTLPELAIELVEVIGYWDEELDGERKARK